MNDTELNNRLDEICDENPFIHDYLCSGSNSEEMECGILAYNLFGEEYGYAPWVEEKRINVLIEASPKRKLKIIQKIQKSMPKYVTNSILEFSKKQTKNKYFVKEMGLLTYKILENQFGFDELITNLQKRNETRQLEKKFYISKRKTISDLENELRDVIALEKFERAAELRDKIKEISR